MCPHVLSALVRCAPNVRHAGRPAGDALARVRHTSTMGIGSGACILTPVRCRHCIVTCRGEPRRITRNALCLPLVPLHSRVESSGVASRRMHVCSPRHVRVRVAQLWHESDAICQRTRQCMLSVTRRSRSRTTIFRYMTRACTRTRADCALARIATALLDR